MSKNYAQVGLSDCNELSVLKQNPGECQWKAHFVLKQNLNNPVSSCGVEIISSMLQRTTDWTPLFHPGSEGINTDRWLVTDAKGRIFSLPTSKEK